VTRARLVGINHVALEVGDVDEALDFYGRFFELELRGRVRGMAFVDLGDQFLALAEGRAAAPDRHRHFGLVVDDKEAVRAALVEAGVEVSRGRSLDFRDPWRQPGRSRRLPRHPVHEGAVDPRGDGARRAGEEREGRRRTAGEGPREGARLTRASQCKT
jgi:catechol 2,3-dioxygenase-like lactoylglutathione lyase family enzyme